MIRVLLDENLPRKLKWSLGAALLSMFLAACDSTNIQVDETLIELSIKTDKEEYESRDTPLAYVTNLSGESVFLHSCSGTLEWKGYWSWVSISGPGANLWEPPEIFRVDPGETALCAIYGRSGGFFRYVFDIRDVDGDLLPRESRATNAFSMKGQFE